MSKNKQIKQQKSCKSKKGFTLAEVLVTLAIIGIVAALTIPTLITNMQNAQLNAAARKAYAIASNAYMQAVNDNGKGFGGMSFGTPLSYTKFDALKSHLNIVRECPYGSGSLGNCWAPTPIGSTAGPAGCGAWGTGNNYQNNHYSFVTSDGMYWMLYCYNAVNGADDFAIDVNGAKGPNDWGKDVFIFLMLDTTLVPMTGNSFMCVNITHNDGTLITSQDMNPLH